jgi:cytidylate kinase
MKYNIITIEREYASGGSAIGKKLSKALGIPVYGHEILELVAGRLGTDSAQIEHLEETATNSIIYSVAMMAQMATGEMNGLSKESELYLAEAEIIKNLADKGSCIIIGHCANGILRDRKDVLNVFIHADYEARKKRAVEEYGYDGNKIEHYLKKQDRRRANFYSANSRRVWDSKTEYHLMLDSSKLGLEKCVDIIQYSMK